MTFEQLIQEPGHLLLKSISGSRAYNLHLPTSDTDIKGIFVLPEKELFGLGYTEQLSDAGNDEVYFEVGRFMDLLCKNNPNILELLNSPEKAVLYKHPLMRLIRPEDFLSRRCLQTFAGYAKTQIKKASGLNKMINRPMDGPRKGVTDFCYVIAGNGSLPLQQFLSQKNWRQEDCGLVKVDHFRDTYLLYHGAYNGIVSGDDANDVQLSSVPKDAEPAAVMTFNKDGYSVYCKEYASYQTWVAERNEVRYQGTMDHGQGYDAKNMMHTIRLLSMAEEIAVQRRVNVHRQDREFLLRIRQGAYKYEELLKIVEDKMNKIERLYAASDLPDEPDAHKAEEILVQIRTSFYVR
ncbi:nucleotidyltransferase domain-containing protein [Chitinophaga sedimenti]|uniref:DNA polymerase beta superfamily protein n=1 Tax=Chitinophaga sedimenti TaxID=2033606 RepID=UPI002005AEFD|nr:nucleotidyltransferase domain-containing protein [Chitinophaga sedimenti]MCK7558372.1 nucleotidyltransferase domain-containing protein [Chitinophaga sedimenti]